VSTNGVYATCGSTGVTCPSGYFCTAISLQIGSTSSINNYCCPTRSRRALYACPTSTRVQAPYVRRRVSTACSARRRQSVDGFSTAPRATVNSLRMADVQAIVTTLPHAHNACLIVTQRVCMSFDSRKRTHIAVDCPDGQVALQDASTGTLTQCAVGGACPDSRYTCVSSTLFGSGVCCGSNAPVGMIIARVPMCLCSRTHARKGSRPGSTRSQIHPTHAHRMWSASVRAVTIVCTHPHAISTFAAVHRPRVCESVVEG
jgi:hypothetical protein